MKVFLFGMMLLFSTASYCQKIAADEIDDFNGTRKVKTTSEKISKGQYGEAMASTYILKLNNLVDTSTTLYIFFRTSTVTSLREKDFIYLKFADGSVEKLKYRGSYRILSSAQIAGAYAYIEPEILNKIYGNKIVKIRVETSNENIDIDVDEKYQHVIPTALKLVVDRVYNPSQNK